MVHWHPHKADEKAICRRNHRGISSRVVDHYFDLTSTTAPPAHYPSS